VFPNSERKRDQILASMTSGIPSRLAMEGVELLAVKELGG